MAGAGTEPLPRGETDVIVGYALTEKKCRSLFSPDLIAHARCVSAREPSPRRPAVAPGRVFPHILKYFPRAVARAREPITPSPVHRPTRDDPREALNDPTPRASPLARAGTKACTSSPSTPRATSRTRCARIRRRRRAAGARLPTARPARDFFTPPGRPPRPPPSERVVARASGPSRSRRSLVSRARLPPSLLPARDSLPRSPPLFLAAPRSSETQSGWAPFRRGASEGSRFFPAQGGVGRPHRAVRAIVPRVVRRRPPLRGSPDLESGHDARRGSRGGVEPPRRARAPPDCPLRGLRVARVGAGGRRRAAASAPREVPPRGRHEPRAQGGDRARPGRPGVREPRWRRRPRAAVRRPGVRQPRRVALQGVRRRRRRHRDAEEEPPGPQGRAEEQPEARQGREGGEAANER